MQARPFLAATERAKDTRADTWREEVWEGDADFVKATLEAMDAFAKGQETILLEELRAEIA